MTTTTLNPTDKYVDIVLSNGNLTATYTAAPSGNSGGGSIAAGNRNIRATQSGVAGRYFEVTFGLASNSGSTPGIGLANAGQSLITYPGNPNGAAWFGSGYAEWPGSGTGNAWPNLTAGSVLGVYLKTSTIEFYKDGSLVGTANALPSGALYPILSFANSGENATVNFGATPLAHLPVGATSWDGSQTSTPTTGSAFNSQDKFADIVLSNNNLTATYTTTRGSGNVNIRGVTTGSAGRYFEVKFSNIVTGQGSTPGVGVANATQSLTSYPGNPNAAAWFQSSYAEWPGSGTSNLWSQFAANDVIGVLLEAGDVKFYKNGTLVGTAAALPSGALYPVVSLANNTDSATINVGGTPMAYLPVGATSWDGSQTNTPTSGNGLNPSDKFADIVLSNNNLTATFTTTRSSGNANVRGAKSASAGHYFEVTFSKIIAGQVSGPGIGVANLSQVQAYPGDPNGAAWFQSGYAEWPGSGFTHVWSQFAANDVLGVLLEAGDVKFYKNGVLVGTTTSVPSGALYPIISLANNSESATINVGATALTYLPVGATSWDGSQFNSGTTGGGGGTTSSGFILNPSDKATSVVLTNGNLTAATTTTSGSVRGAAAGGTDKYFEVTFTGIGSGAGGLPGIGVANASQALTNPSYPGNPNGVGWFASNYAEWPGGAANWSDFAAGDVLGVLLKSSSVQFYKNGTLVGTSGTVPSGALYPIVFVANNGDVATANFGATALRYLPQNATSWDGSQSNFGIGWNSADKNAGIQLSNNNLTATLSGATSSANVDIRGSIAAQPNRYFEVKFSTLVSGQTHTAGLGLANSTQSLSASPGDPSGAAWFQSGHAEWPGSGTANNFGTFAAGDVLGVLIKTVTTTTGGTGTGGTGTGTGTGGTGTGTGTGTGGTGGTTSSIPDFSIVDFGSTDFFAGGSTSGTMTDFAPSDFGFDFLGGSPGATGSGVYNITGYPAAIVHSLPASLTTGTYALTGRAAGLKAGRKIALAKGTYVLTGKSAALAHSGFKVALSGGAYALTGRNTSMQDGIPVRSGTFTLTGYAADIANIRPYGLYALTGGAAGLRVGEPAAVGSYAITGQTAGTAHGHGMLLGSGSFKLSGAELTPIADGDTSATFERRLKSLIPRGWVLRTAPIFDAVLGGLGDSLANFYSLLKSVKQQTRIATASGWFLDLIGWDFLGANYLRKYKEADDHWRARIIREVLRPRATRLGITTALEDLTGRTPKIYEAWNATDDGGGYGAVGGRIAYGQSGYYGSVVLPAQVFVTAYKAGFSGIPNITGYGYGNGGYGAGTIAYASLTQVEGEISDAEIFDCVHQNIAAGAKAWVAIGVAQIAKTNMPAGRGTFTLTGNAAATTYNPVALSPQVTQFFNRLITMPSASRQTAYSNLIDGLVAAGVWARLDALFIYAANDPATGLTNLVQEPHRGFVDDLTGVPVFTIDRGWSATGAAGNRDVNTNFNPSTAAGNYTQNDAMICAWQIGSVHENAFLVSDISNDGKIELIPHWSTGAVSNWAINGDGTELGSPAPTDVSGFWLMQRTASNACELHNNDTLIGTSSATSAALVNQNIVVNPVTNKAACFGIGASLNSAQQTALYNAMLAYMTAVGAA